MHGGFFPADHDRPGGVYQGNHIGGGRRLAHQPPLRHDRVRDPHHELPRHPHRPGPRASTTSPRGAPSRPVVRLVLAGDAAGRRDPHLPRASTSTRAPTPTAACTSCPGWGGCMFEELMPDVFVPEATLGAAQLGPSTTRCTCAPSASTASTRRGTATGASRPPSNPLGRLPRVRRRPARAQPRRLLLRPGDDQLRRRASATAARARTRPRPTATASSPRTPSFLAMMHEPVEAFANLVGSRTTSSAYGQGGFFDAVAVRLRHDRPPLPLARPGDGHGRVGNVLATTSSGAPSAPARSSGPCVRSSVSRSSAPAPSERPPPRSSRGEPPMEPVSRTSQRRSDVPRPQRQRADGPLRGPTPRRRRSGSRTCWAGCRLAEKVGLMFHTVIEAGADGSVLEAPGRISKSATSEVVLGKHLTHFNVHALDDAADGGAVAQRPAGARRADTARHPGHRSPPTRGTRSSRTPGRRSRPRRSRSGPSRSGSRPCGTPTLVRAVRRHRPRRSTSRSASGPPCTRRSTSPPSRAGPGRRSTFGQDPAARHRAGPGLPRGFQGDRARRRTASPAPPSTSPAAARRRTARTRTSPTAASRSTPADVSTTTSSPFPPVIEAGDAAIMPYYGMPVGPRRRRRADRAGRLRLQPPGRHRPAARAARLRRRRPHRLGARQRQPRRRPGAAGPRLGRRAPRPARPDGAASCTPAPTSSAARSASTCCSTWCATAG